jgi:alkanesulfonate monooxygenase
MGQTQQPQHDDRYAQAEEYMKVMDKLFQSPWRDDAVQLDHENGIYTSPDLVRQINHRGKFFTVPGPHIVQPSPQRTPLLLQLVHRVLVKSLRLNMHVSLPDAEAQVNSVAV